MQFSSVNSRIILTSLFVIIHFGLCGKAKARHEEPRGEIRVVDNFRSDINVLGHNVLQYLFEYALEENRLSASLGVFRQWIDDTTLEVKLRQGGSSPTGSRSTPML